MKILFAIQGTGNGHLSRASEIIPHLQHYGDLDVLVTATHHEVKLPYFIKYKKPGLGFTFGKRGGINYIDTIRKFSPVRFMRDLLLFPVGQYDLVINDFEPLSAWACRLKGLPCFGLSHHASFLSDKTPRPEVKSRGVEKLFRAFAPASQYLGFHFQPYDSFIRLPVIRSAVRQQEVSNRQHVTVYLPAFADSLLIRHLSLVEEVRFEVFSKHCRSPYRYENVHVYPVSGEKYLESMAQSLGVICGAGFEGPAEVLYLRKQLLVIPMKDQYEQKCNAAALEQMGVPVLHTVNRHFASSIRSWLDQHITIPVHYPDQTGSVVEEMMHLAMQGHTASQPAWI